MTIDKESGDKDLQAALPKASARSCLAVMANRMMEMEKAITAQGGALNHHADTMNRFIENDDRRHDGTDRRLDSVDRSLEDIRKSVVAAVHRFNAIIFTVLLSLVSGLAGALFYFATNGWPWAGP